MLGALMMVLGFLLVGEAVGYFMGYPNVLAFLGAHYVDIINVALGFLGVFLFFGGIAAFRKRESTVTKHFDGTPLGGATP